MTSGDTYKLELALNVDNLFFRVHLQAPGSEIKIVEAKIREKDLKGTGMLGSAVDNLEQLVSYATEHPENIVLEDDKSALRIMVESPLNKSKVLLASLPLREVRADCLLEEVLRDCVQKEDLSNAQVRDSF